MFRRTRRGEQVGVAWLRTTRGVARRRAVVDPERAELLAWQEVLPATAQWTHLTAASRYGWWLPPLPSSTPRFALVDPLCRPRRRGLVVFRRAVSVSTELDGVRLASPAEVLVDCARDLAELDLACLVAGALATHSCTREELTAAAARPSRGAATLRRVVDRTAGNHESIWEVVLTEMHHAFGIDVEPQHEIFDDHGSLVARGDVWLKGTRALQEYDGEAHLGRAGQRRDLRRNSDLQRCGWERHGYVKEDVIHGAARVLANAEAALGWPHDPSRVRGWHAMLRVSLFSAAGRALMGGRWCPPGSPTAA